MSSQLLRKYIEIISEMNQPKKISQLDANYTSKALGKNKCYHCTHFIVPNSCEVVSGVISPEGWCKYYEQGSLDEKWGEPTVVNPSERGKYEGKTLEQLHKAYNALKASGPHHKGSPEYGRMRELAFAIRAKTGWGKV